MNNIWSQCIGNLGHDVTLQYTDDGKLFGKTSVAVEVGYGDKKDTLWLQAVVWGEQNAQRFHDYCQKGTRVYLTGTPGVNAWKTKDGDVRSQMTFTIQEFRVLSGGRPKEDAEPTPYDGE